MMNKLHSKIIENISVSKWDDLLNVVTLAEIFNTSSQIKKVG